MVKAASSGEPRGLAEQLRGYGLRRVLVQMAERGQLIDLRCEMPQCYCDKGRNHFERKTNPMRDWAPTPDHSPILKSAGGHLTPDNVRLAHVLCNRRDYGWRMKIKAMLAKGMSLEAIADKLNQKQEPTPPGVVSWSAAVVRAAFVS